MIIDSYAINIDLKQKRASGRMFISHDLDSDDWISIEYVCDLVTYHEQPLYFDGYMVRPEAYICKNVKSVQYIVSFGGCDASSYDNIEEIIAEYVVQKSNCHDTPDLYTYRGRGAA